MNLVVAFQNTPGLLQLAEQFLECFFARIERLQVVVADKVKDTNVTRVRYELNKGFVVLINTNLDPAVRAHISKVGPFDVLTISIAAGEKQEILNAVQNLIRRTVETAAAAVGDEIEMELDSCNRPIFVGDDVSIIKGQL